MKLIPDPNALRVQYLGALTRRDHALCQARELFMLGHRQAVVNALICEARLHNSLLVRVKRALKRLGEWDK